jgi:hypothetical protein
MNDRRGVHDHRGWGEDGVRHDDGRRLHHDRWLLDDHRGWCHGDAALVLDGGAQVTGLLAIRPAQANRPGWTLREEAEDLLEGLIWELRDRAHEVVDLAHRQE